jgi:hypothetical protein
MGARLVDADSKKYRTRKGHRQTLLRLGLQVKFSPIHTIDKSMVNSFVHETTAETDLEA